METKTEVTGLVAEGEQVIMAAFDKTVEHLLFHGTIHGTGGHQYCIVAPDTLVERIDPEISWAINTRCGSTSEQPMESSVEVNSTL